MQIVINVNDELVEYFANHNSMNDDGWFSHSSQLLNAFRNGTPLPKGHGRLIDADVLCDYFWDNRSKLYTHKDLQIVIDNAPTIIEADKAESEDQK